MTPFKGIFGKLDGVAVIIFEEIARVIFNRARTGSEMDESFYIPLSPLQPFKKVILVKGIYEPFSDKIFPLASLKAQSQL